MPLAIRLLGTPSIDVDGVAGRPPRGRKSWGLLAYILLAERPPSRKRLAALLFDEADDPLGALRWSLAEIRRSLRPYAEVSGDPVTITFADQPPAVIDIVAGGADDATGMSDGELLEGMSFAGCEAFETWLLVARRRVAGTVEAVLREEAFRQLTAGRPAVAVTLAARLVARNPLDETFQELLVRCLATSGQRDAALTQAAKSAQLVRRELGIEPSPSVRRAADAVPGTVSTSPNVGRATARAQLEAGHAAISAGAVDAGIERLRRAVADARGVRRCSTAPRGTGRTGRCAGPRRAGWRRGRYGGVARGVGCRARSRRRAGLRQSLPRARFRRRVGGSAGPGRRVARRSRGAGRRGRRRAGRDPRRTGDEPVGLRPLRRGAGGARGIGRARRPGRDPVASKPGRCR